MLTSMVSLLLISLSCLADAALAPGETFASRTHWLSALSLIADEDPTQVWGARKPLAQVDFSGVPLWSDAQLAETFVELRDQRALQWDGRPDFPRRIHWLYHHNGCWARADRVRKLLESNRPSQKIWKIYIFGALSAPHPYGWDGDAGWWYHVAPIVRTSRDAFVIDPSVSPTQPLPVLSWIDSIAPQGRDSIEISLCAAESYAPDEGVTECFPPEAIDDASLDWDNEQYLAIEWRFAILAGADPELALGDSPPWR